MVAAASLANITPEENGCPGLIMESSYLIWTLLMEILRIPIMVANREPSHEFAAGGLPSFDLDIDEVPTSVAVNGVPNSRLLSFLDGIRGTELTESS
ncbi:hypothetical protein PVL29_015975 [Vitis rotundifolia]|uniref:Uncharacterized protein n=1 Tax=Vitis rotundifolia TaxID=103349 RepID=A0AA38ZE14_VITRO|nr:hypothetical protein PVL29_015975 [Vitis rotundifolia]